MAVFLDNLKQSLEYGFINQHSNNSGSFKPELLINNTKKSESVLTSLVEELQHSESFIFSVAFITESGLAMLKSHLLDLKNKGVKGQILTSTFLHFNQPKVFRELLKLENVEVRLANLAGFHSKGYIFKQKTHYSLIVGSSNLTANAMKVNYEWNVKLNSHENGDIVHHFKNQFEDVWEQSQKLTEQWIEEYEKTYTPAIHPKNAQVVELPTGYDPNSIEIALKIKPNKMQEVALQQIEAVRLGGKKKTLVISATGTGKTYLSAFDVRRVAPKRMLFIVHREQILQSAKESFRKILGGPTQDFGVLSGSMKETKARYLFATIQTISKKEVLGDFNPNDFDYILIDEVHKAGAASYQKVIEYFKPDFLMGMTATPERTDDFNIYGLFDYNVAYEIRLQEALEEDMLCPFHYFGVTDLEYHGQTIDETTILSKLVTEERVNHLLEKIHYYGHSGESVKGLIFCSRKEEANKLASELNARNLRTVALTGEDSQQSRQEQVRRLESGELDYLITVDIFNEGIDIPTVNQVVMLRQTQSSIIFIQQLGRGLRKHPSKEYVTIIDFIGNYKNNYLIPVALSGDKSQNKDNIRRRVADTSYIKGVSTINFEEVAKAKIFKSINNINLSVIKMLKESYDELKKRIGRNPYMNDFIVNQSIDPLVITGKYKNYYQFLQKIKEDTITLTEYENSVLTMLSVEILNGKRKHEIVLLDLLMKNSVVSYEAYIDVLKEMNCSTDEKIVSSVEKVLDLGFFTAATKKLYGDQSIVIVNENGDYVFNERIQSSLSTKEQFKEFVEDIIKTGQKKMWMYSDNFSLTLYEKYSRKDVCRLLNWEKDESSTMYGYKTKHGTCPIFITYHKGNEVEASVAYGDELINSNVLKWYTRSNRSLQSQEVQTIIQAVEKNIDIHLFVKKDDDEGIDFYYLGKAQPDKESIRQEKMVDKNSKELPVVTMNMVMEQPITSNLYHYIKEGN